MNKLRIVGDVNKLSDQVYKHSELKKGAVAVFRLLGGHKDPKTGEIHFGSHRDFVCHDHIVDPETGSVVEIGIPQITEGKDKVKTWKRFTLNGGGAQGLVGERFVLNGSRPADQELYSYFMLCNMNASNPNRDGSVVAKIELIDQELELKKRSVKRNSLYEALDKARNLKDGEVRMLAAAMGQDFRNDIEVLRDMVEEYATNNTAEFLARYENPDTERQAYVKAAIQLGVLKYDAIPHSIKWGQSGETIAQLDRHNTKNEVQLFVEWLHAKTDGENIYKQIEKAYGQAAIKTGHSFGTTNTEPAKSTAAPSSKAQAKPPTTTPAKETEKTEVKK